MPMLAMASMAKWRIDSGASARYPIFKDTDESPVLELDASEADELIGALLAELQPPGFPLNGSAPSSPRVSLRVGGGQIEVTISARVVSMARHEALGLFAVLVTALGRQPEAAPIAWQCVVCKVTSSVAAGQRPSRPGCGGWKNHRWVPEGAVYFASTLETALPSGQRTAVVRDADAEARRGTACRVDARHGDPIGVVLITDGYACRAPLDSIAEQVVLAAQELGRLRQRRQEDTHLVFVSESGVRLQRR